MTKIFISMRDIALVARFELQRNLRTWRAFALCLIYILATGGGAYLFTRFLLQAENIIAATLGVPELENPGTMTDKLMENEMVRGAVGKMIGDEAYVDVVLGWPLMAIFYLWLGIWIVPFLASATSAESIVIDTANRAARFECTRTGRVEFVSGRFLGQAIMMFVASVSGALATWAVTMVYMVNQEPLEMLQQLVFLSPRLWVLSLPFIGLGVAASQVTKSANMARVLAVVGAITSWILYGVSSKWLADGGSSVWDIVLQVLPQNYMDGLWNPEIAWVGSGAVLVLLGLIAMASGLPTFMRKDL